jgi:hypothetical protein
MEGQQLGYKGIVLHLHILTLKFSIRLEDFLFR